MRNPIPQQRVRSFMRLTVTAAALAATVVAGSYCGGKESPSGPTQAPNAPGSFQVAATSATAAHLSWVENSTGVVGFRVYRSDVSGGHVSLLATLGANVLAYDDQGLTPATTYYYCIHAFNSVGESAPHVAGSATTPTGEAAPAIALSSGSVTFTAVTGGSSPIAQTVAITNGGGGTLNGLAVGTVTYGAGASGWLAASISAATAPATVTLTPTLGSLAAGSYTATVPVTSTASGVTNSPRNISVTFTVSAVSPAIGLNPTSVTFTATAGGSSPAAQTVAVSNAGNGTLSGLAVGTITYGAGASGWLAASVSPTTAPATVTLTPTLGSLAAGSYTATVPVTSSASGVTNSPQNVSVTFTVNPATLRPGPTLGTPSISGGTITLTWTYSWPVLGSSNDAYHLEQSTTSSSSGFTEIAVYTTRVSPYSVSLTRASGTYWYRVRVGDAQGWTGYSQVQSATVVGPKITVVNNMSTGLNIHEVVQVKLGQQGVAFGAADLLTNDSQSSCLSLPGESIAAGASRTFDETVGANYAIYLGIGTWDMDNFNCSYLSPFFKRTWFTDTNFNIHYVYTIVNINNHTSGTVTFTISGSYLDLTLKVVVTYGGQYITTVYFTRT